MAMCTLSPAQSSDLTDLFELFDSDRDGKLSAVDVASALRLLGLAVGFESDAEFPMELKEFKALLAPKVASCTASLSACFTSFDESGAGKMPLADLRHALTTLGDPLSEEEAARFTERCSAGAGSSGTIDMKRFLKALA